MHTVDKNNLTPWNFAPQLPSQQTLLQNSIKDKFEVDQLFCSTLKNLAMPLSQSTQIVKNRLNVKRAQSCLTRYRSLQIPIRLVPQCSTQNKNFQLQSLKLEAKKLQSLEYLSLSQKEPPKANCQIKLYEKRQRAHSAVLRSSEKKRIVGRSPKIGQKNKKIVQEGNIFINEKIESLIKNTKNKTKFSAKINSIIKGYAKSHIPQTVRENQIRRQRFLRQLFAPQL